MHHITNIEIENPVVFMLGAKYSLHITFQLEVALRVADASICPWRTKAIINFITCLLEIHLSLRTFSV